MRINKYLKDKGLTTRRGADDLIKKGAVLINGKIAKLGDEVEKNDAVTIKNKSGVNEESLYYIAYNKPIGILTNKDTASGTDILSHTVFKNDKNEVIKVFPVGRLDKDSHGLILLTNDGRVTDKLLSPRFLHEKEYLVHTDRPFNDFFLSALSAGVRIDGSVTRKAIANRVKSNSLKIILTEGKKRQIRRMCEALHHNVVDLERIRIMNVLLGSLKDGEYRHLTKEERKIFLSSLYLQELGSMIIAKKTPKPPVIVSPAPKTAQLKTKSAQPAKKKQLQKNSRPKKFSSRSRSK